MNKLKKKITAVFLAAFVLLGTAGAGGEFAYAASDDYDGESYQNVDIAKLKQAKVTGLTYAKKNDYYWSQYFSVGFQWNPLDQYYSDATGLEIDDMFVYYLNGEYEGDTYEGSYEKEDNKVYLTLESDYDDLERGHGYTLTVTPHFYINQEHIYGEATSLKFATKPYKVGQPTVKTSKGKATISWTKKYGSGYQIQVATDSKFKQDKQSYKTTSYKKTSTTVSNLKSGKTYYVRVRAYKTYGNTAYGSWSKVTTFVAR